MVGVSAPFQCLGFWEQTVPGMWKLLCGIAAGFIPAAGLLLTRVGNRLAARPAEGPPSSASNWDLTRHLARAIAQTSACVVITDLRGNITYVNRGFTRITGYEPHEALGKNPRILKSGLVNPSVYRELWHQLASGQEWHGEFQNRRKNGELYWGLACISPLTDAEGRITHYLGVLEETTEVRQLVEEQRIGVSIANRLLTFINAAPPRYVDLDDDRSLFVTHFWSPCHSAGGDHFFIRTIKSDSSDHVRTVVSLKDQSGHEVNCILRSIASDFVHHTSDRCCPGIEQSLHRLNNELCRSGMFNEDDFFTSLTLEIDHDNRLMRYASCGHTPLLLIRGPDILAMPRPGEPGHNLPVGSMAGAAYTAGEFALKDGDRLLLYTDGLTEMPLHNGGARLSTADLIAILRSILAERPDLGMCQLVHTLVDKIAAISGERLRANEPGTAADDVTVLGLELENRVNACEQTLCPVNLDEVCQNIEDLHALIATQWGTQGATSRRLRLLIEEAILNAWKHGNGSRPGDPIRVRWWRGNDACIEVTDQGQGFDPDAVPDPRTLEHRSDISGRGIFLIKESSDSARWRNGGTQLIASVALCTAT